MMLGVSGTVGVSNVTQVDASTGFNGVSVVGVQPVPASSSEQTPASYLNDGMLPLGVSIGTPAIPTPNPSDVGRCGINDVGLAIESAAIGLDNLGSSPISAMFKFAGGDINPIISAVTAGGGFMAATGGNGGGRHLQYV